ncbi:MAG: DUF362 domain-containing protein [Acidobacteriaceae bacterium]|nr:DUF362 domain-containing protein [Acidobacteriaceae bacterium]
MTPVQSLTRRHFFFGALALSSSCRRTVIRNQRTRVSIVRAGSYSRDLESLIRHILLEHRLQVTGKTILLKPNLVEFDSSAPVNTHPVFVAAVAAAFRALGASEVRIAEGPGHRRTTLDLASSSGYFTAVEKFERIFTDLNVDEVSRVPILRPFSTLSELYLPQTSLACDLLVSLPKMKTHHWTGATLAMKNLFGVVPGAVYGWPKNLLHWAGIDECVADLHYLFPRQFCLVDGIEGMQGNGPILGTRIRSGVIVAGAHPPSVDATCCRIMQIDPEKVRYLQLVARRSGINFDSIDQIGESLRSVTTRFALIPPLERFRLDTPS